MRLIKGAHAPDVERGEAGQTGELPLQIGGHALDDFFAVVSVALGVHDGAAEVPVEGDQLAVDAGGGLELRGADAGF